MKEWKDLVLHGTTADYISLPGTTHNIHSMKTDNYQKYNITLVRLLSSPASTKSESNADKSESLRTKS